MIKTTVAFLAACILAHLPSVNCQCDGSPLVLTAQTQTMGILTSPGYPTAYSNHLTCQWRITSSSSNVYINFTDASMEPGYDHVYVYDSNTASGSSYDVTEARWISTDQNAFIQLITDYSVTYPGFSLTYIAYDASKGCLSSVSTTSTPQQIAFLYGCITTLTPSVTSKRIQLDVVFIRINQRPSDSFWIFDGNSLLSNLNVARSYLISTDNTARLQFSAGSSDSSVFVVHSLVDTTAVIAPTTAPPTTAAINDACGAESLAASDTPKYITSPGYPGFYSNNLECHWTITSYDAVKQSVQITLIDVYLEEPWDTLKVFDGPSTYYEVVASENIVYGSMTIQSTGSSLHVMFYTDGSIVYRGFQLSYSSTNRVLPSCVPDSYETINVTASEQYIESPGYPTGYSDNIVTYWLLVKPSESDNIVFEVTDIDIEYSLDCVYDKVTIYDGPCIENEKVAEFCGNTKETYKDESSFYYLVSFTSDHVVQAKGFQMKVYIGSVDEGDDSTDGLWVFIVIVVVMIVAFLAIVAVVTVCIVKRSKKVQPGTVYPAKSTTSVKLRSTSDVLHEIKSKPIPEPKKKIKRKQTLAYIQAVSAFRSGSRPEPPFPPQSPHPAPMPSIYDPAYPPGSSTFPGLGSNIVTPGSMAGHQVLEPVQGPSGFGQGLVNYPGGLGPGLARGTTGQVYPAPGGVPAPFEYKSSSELKQMWTQAATT